MPVFSADRLLWKADCELCAAQGAGLVCGACERSLSRAGAACRRCAIALPAEGVCGACLRHPPSFDESLAAFDYVYPLNRLVQRFKYAGDLAIGSWLAHALAQRVACAPSPDVVVAPPSTFARLRARGFNPALEIAKTVARVRGARCALTGITRQRDTDPQPGLAREARRRNLRDAFACRIDVRGAHVTLVDDVLTTGATADSVAGILKQAGAARVSVWIVARTPQPDV